ncbi:Fc.00g001370.m01.CDS01 [Cosmosporella sp. VM-42]
MSGKFWCLQYSPFGGLLKTCDNTTCTARRYRVHMRVALSRLGVPWAVVFGLDLAAEPGKFGLQPALHLERIANFTAPGFEILWKLSEDILKWEDAESQFRVLYKSDPTFVNQVDPRGHGYLEKAVSHGAWGMAGMHIERQKQLLHFFVKELQATKGIDSSTFMYDCASFSCDNRHLDIINAVVALGCDFSSTPSPNFDSWPQPCVHDPGYTEFCRIIPEDPFYLEYLETILETNPDFGDSPPLHNLIIHGSQKDFELLVQKSQPLERNVNFLGQSALHLAVRYPSRLAALLAASHDVSVHDKNGITPLMYAAAMNKTEAVTALIEHGADLFARDKLENYDFIMYAAVRDHWSLVWRAIDVIESRDSSLLPRVFPSIFTTPGIWRYMAHDPTDLKTGWQSFWEKVASKFPNPNVWFDNGGTLMHFVDHPLIAVLFVRLGYNMFNHRNHLGEHSVFTIAKLLDASLFRLFIKKGADINQQNHEGKTVLHGLVDRLPNTRQPTTKKILDTLEVLLDNGADANVRDHCACDCSPGGCLPGSRISLKVIILFGTTVNNPFWAFVWLLLLEDRGLLAEAKDYALSVLRREYFEEAGLRHTCCQSNELDEMDGREEQFWDIPDQLRRDERRDELDEKMRDWGARDYQDVKLGIATHLQQCQPIAEAERPREVRKTKPDEIQATSTGTNDHGTLSFEINYEKDVMYSAVDLMFIRGLSDMKLDLLDGKQENETKQCFDEFIDTLRETGGDKFSSWKLRLDHLSKHFV